MTLVVKSDVKYEAKLIIVHLLNLQKWHCKNTKQRINQVLATLKNS